MHEIHIVDDIIISISTSFYNNFKMKIFIEGENGSMFKLKVKSSILDFANFLNVNNYFWEMDKANSRDKTLGIKINSLTTLMYSFEKGEEGVVQISSFDRLLYNKISEKYHT